MGRKIDVTNLVGAQEIADRLGLARPQTIHVWRRRHRDFPKPVASLKTALIWDWTEIQDWINSTGRNT